jgi:hypothetical protein
MRCPNCRVESVEEDIYCRRCGRDLAETPMSIIPAQSSLPALLYKSPVPRRVVAGVGALALGVGIEILRRNILTRLFPARTIRRSLSVGPSLKDVAFSQPDKAMKLPKGHEMYETVVYMTRVIRRQN